MAETLDATRQTIGAVFFIVAFLSGAPRLEIPRGAPVWYAPHPPARFCLPPGRPSSPQSVPDRAQRLSATPPNP